MKIFVLLGLVSFTSRCISQKYEHSVLIGKWRASDSANSYLLHYIFSDSSNGKTKMQYQIKPDTYLRDSVPFTYTIDKSSTDKLFRIVNTSHGHDEKGEAQTIRFDIQIINKDAILIQLDPDKPASTLLFRRED